MKLAEAVTGEGRARLGDDAGRLTTFLVGPVTAAADAVLVAVATLMLVSYKRTDSWLDGQLRFYDTLSRQIAAISCLK